MSNKRKQIIIKASLINGIGTLFLACVKIGLGILSSSQAMIADAINYYSDVLIVAAICGGTILATKEPDKKHPYGYGRIEYVGELLIALFIIYNGLMAMKGNIVKMLHPVEPHYTAAGIAILTITVIAKYIVSKHLITAGKQAGSMATTATGNASVRKAKASVLAILAAILYVATGINLDAYIGLLIGFLVTKAGATMLFKTISNILGNEHTFKEANEIKKTIASFDAVIGAYDLVLHNYGPDTVEGAVHIEVNDTMSMHELDVLQREIVDKVEEVHGIHLGGISIYAVDQSENEDTMLREDIRKLVKANGALGMHGFYVDHEKKYISFDAVYDLNNEDRHNQFRRIEREVFERYPEYKIQIQMDLNLV